jgi:hypothetical protein
VFNSRDEVNLLIGQLSLAAELFVELTPFAKARKVG